MRGVPLHRTTFHFVKEKRDENEVDACCGCVGGRGACLLTCRTATNYLMVIQEQLMAHLKVPSLVVEGDIVDVNLFDLSGAIRKAETFEETMEYYRKVRKDAGFDW